MSKWANEVGLLRRTINNLVLKKFSGVIDEDVLQNLGLARGKITPTGFVGLLHDGVGPFSSLAESMFSQHPNVQRGTTLDSYQIQLLNILISDYLDREAASIDSGDVERIELGLLSWFSIEAGSRTVFIPCVISPSRSSCFSIGPVSFLYREDVQKSKYYPDAKNLGQFTNFEFESLPFSFCKCGSSPFNLDFRFHPTPVSSLQSSIGFRYYFPSSHSLFFFFNSISFNYF